MHKFMTDMDRLNFVVHRYRNNTYVKDTERELKLTEYKKLLSKRVNILSYIDVFCERCICWIKQLLNIKVNSIKNGCSFPHEHFPIVPGIKNVIWTQECSHKPISKCMFLLGFKTFFT